MKYLIISDVHGNLPALERVFKTEKDYDILISLGDVVNYGPWSNECVDLLDTLDNNILLTGNHESFYLNGKYDGNNKVAYTFFNHCFPQFNKFNLIKEYTSNYKLFDFNFAHTIDDLYLYEDSNIVISENYFIGHSHRIFKKNINDKILVNVGSVGQNRININEINYAVWDQGNNKIDLKSIVYDSNILLQEMKKRNYPDICLDYIKSKQK